jgi:hypothetical protein
MPTAQLDGGDGKDTLLVKGGDTATFWGVQQAVVLGGGAGNDRLEVRDNIAGLETGFGSSRGIAHAQLDGGRGDDTLIAGGALQVEMTGGAGRDTFVLTAQQWRTEQEGPRFFSNPASPFGVDVVDASPVRITDFQAGRGGDVLDLTDLTAVASAGTARVDPFGSQGLFTLEQLDGDVLVSFDANAGSGNAPDPWVVAVLAGVDLGSLRSTNFSTAVNPTGGPRGAAPTASAQVINVDPGSARAFNGAGVGVMDGNAGNDAFVFGRVASTAGQVDRLTGVRSGTDHREFDADLSTPLAMQNMLDAGVLRAGAEVNPALDTHHPLLGDSSAGKLYYDAGTSAGVSGVQVGELGGAVKLALGDPTMAYA